MTFIRFITYTDLCVINEIHPTSSTTTTSGQDYLKSYVSLLKFKILFYFTVKDYVGRGKGTHPTTDYTQSILLIYLPSVN